MTDYKNIKTILNEEYSNIQATRSKFPDETKFIDKLLRLYQEVPGSIKSYPREQTPVLQMFWVCFRGYLISVILILEAHIPEAYAIVSRASEAVASARKMSMNPEKIEGWVKKEKETSQPFRRVLGKLFPPEDKVLSPEILDIYQLSTEHGRHPNFASTIFFSDFGRMRTENKVDFVYTDISDELNLRRCLNYLIHAYTKFLGVFAVVFKNHIKKDWVKDLHNFETEYAGYKETLKTVFLQEEK